MNQARIERVTEPGAVGPAGLSVCMPAYNEAENLPEMIEDVVRTMAPRFPRIEIIVANDGSSDGTAAVLRHLADRYPCLKAVHHERNLGYGMAARSALAAATQDLVLFTDADRQFPLDAIDAFTRAIGECDMVVGFRAPRRDTRSRVLAGRAWSALVNRICGYAARDVNCAFKLVRRRVLEAVLPGLLSVGAAFSAEWLARTRRMGLIVRELPVRHAPRRAGSATGLRPAVAARAVVELVRLRAELRACPEPRA